MSRRARRGRWPPSGSERRDGPGLRRSRRPSGRGEARQGTSAGCPRRVVPGRGDDERARAEGGIDREILEHRLDPPPRLMLMTLGPRRMRGVETRRSHSASERAAPVRVPDAQRGVRVDADDAEPVRRRAPTIDATAVPCGCPSFADQRLRVQGPTSGAARELLVRQVETGVDHRHRLARRRRRLGPVGADRCEATTRSGAAGRRRSCGGSTGWAGLARRSG